MPEFKPGYLRYALTILALSNFINYMDRTILSVALESLKREFSLSDTQVGLLTGLAFAIFYGTIGILMARLADRYDRPKIVAVSMLLWSAFTALTGAAQNFLHLFLARIGVGIGEAGIIPTANALIGDYFEPERRAAALAIFSMGATLGLTAGLSLGGWVAALYGWRCAFVVAGMPGIPLSLLVWKTLRHPTRGLSDGKVEAIAPSMSPVAAARTLFTRKTYVHTTIAGVFMSFMLFGMMQWMPAFVIRKFGLPLAQVGFFFGIAVGLGSALGAILGGFLASRLVQRDRRWLIRLPFILSFLYLPIYELAIFSSSARVTLALVFIINVTGGASFGPMLAVMQSVVPPTMRATAAAFYGFSATLIGTGAAPSLVGMISDVLAPSLGSARSLQIALAIMTSLSLFILFHFYCATRFFERDMIGLPARS